MAWSASERKVETKRTGPGKVVELQPSGKGPAGEEMPRNESDRGRDLAGGMEMLELDFLLSVIEETKGDDKNDVAMRKLGFDEVLRRKQQNQIDSKALTVYSVDEDSLYGKPIQCEAMKELTKRTSQKGKGAG
jgi:hypothetical protein